MYGGGLITVTGVMVVTIFASLMFALVCLRPDHPAAMYRTEAAREQAKPSEHRRRAFDSPGPRKFQLEVLEVVISLSEERRRGAFGRVLPDATDVVRDRVFLEIVC